MTENAFRRSTQQRRTILRELKKLTSHPTAAELHQIVRGNLPRISLGTIYRNLELLASNGAIQKLAISGGEARFDGNPAQHSHLRCVSCGKVIDVHGFSLDLGDAGIGDLDGYEILGYRLEFAGICPACSVAEGTGN